VGASPTRIKQGGGADCRTSAKNLRTRNRRAHAMPARSRIALDSARRTTCSPGARPKEVRMTGQGHWMTVVILIIATSPVVAMWISELIAARRYRAEGGTVRCRSHGNKLVQCTVVRDAKTDEPIGISSCTEFGNPEDVRCARGCLPLFTRQAKVSNITE
jgi:hypothetical protein